MRSTEEALARMGSAQAQQSQSLHQAFQATQALATQASSKEEWITRALEAQVRTSEQTSARPTRIRVTQPSATSKTIEEIREEEARRAQVHAQAELERRLQQQRSDVDAEQVTWADDLQELLNAQMELFQEKVRTLEEARNLDQATIRTLRNVQRIRSRNIPATSPQVQGTQALFGADSATSPKSVTGHSAMYPESSGVTAPLRSESKSPATRRVSHKKRSSKHGGPPDGSSDPSSSDDDSSDGDSDSSSGEAPVHAPLTTTPNGTAVMTFRPYVSSSTLEDFNEDASLPARRRWWERFLNLAPDFRADNVVRDRFKPKRRDRAYVAQADVDANSDDDEPFRDSGDSRVIMTKEAVFLDDKDASGSSSLPDATLTKEDLVHEVCRVMKRAGWTPRLPTPNSGAPMSRQPVAQQVSSYLPRNHPDRNEFCEECEKWRHRPENCWRGAVKPLSPPNGDSVRVGHRKPSEFCVLAYVGPELWTKNHDNGKCMTTLLDNGSVLPERRPDVSSLPSPPEPEKRTEFRLLPGERYGWWGEHDPEEERRQVAVVHGAINDSRTQILLDTGATVSMISLDLAGRLKLMLNSHKQIKVSGLGGVPTYINASAQIKITLGHRVVYVVDVWVANIGEDVDVLLGMDVMSCAGVQLCIQEGLVVLPDEESILMYGDVILKRQGLDLPITPSFGLHLRPGERATARIRYGQGNPLRDVVWAGRGDR
ncbi:unnamed protein product [Phytophthora fragariaefolia]|uniref:Unnamed protein product n=1 Tax=Phytophthora fragariaefolia TaxID=1490495 RepID=A0A9W6XMK4_9STRA|nr:unnamed protein product [Phytophthora fragariaefolia]